MESLFVLRILFCFFAPFSSEQLASHDFRWYHGMIVLLVHKLQYIANVVS